MNEIAVKYCGFQTIEHVQVAASLSIQAMGFILVPNRRRTASLKQVAEMINIIPDHIASVGVFQNPTIKDVEEAVNAGISMIQLHGQETPEFCQQLKQKWDVPIIKVFATDVVNTIAAYQGKIDIVLLDHAAGGAGKVIDWNCIPSVKQIADNCGLPLWIAGGLNKDNLAELYQNYEIDGIDLSSGIETNGIKDQQKMIAIIEEMRKHGEIRK